ncbi:MAG: PEP-CTERM sorting domain-containing protein [Acidobacteriota bacterium]
MHRTTWWMPLAACAFLAGSAFAGPIACEQATLDWYVSLETGCMVGQFQVKDFTFASLAATGGYIPIAASDVTVIPALGPQGGPQLRFVFPEAGFGVTGSQSAAYGLGYGIDPPPVIIRFDEEMEAESPVGRGRAQIFTDLCIGALFYGDSCGDALSASLTVYHWGDSGRKLTDSAIFPYAVGIVGVRHRIELDANGDSADFGALGNRAGAIPEPSTGLLSAFALLGLALAARRRAA